MDLENISIKETYAVLNHLKNINLKDASYDEIRELLLKIYKHIGVKHTLTKGRFIQRGILLDKDPEDFYPKTIQRISYNPAGSSLGRANFDGESIFYGCIATDFIEAYNCTAMEILPYSKVGIKKIPFVISNWTLSEDTEFVIFGDKRLINQNAIATNRGEVFFDNVRNFKEAIIPLYAIDEFLCHEFSREVDRESPWDYKISAVYTSILKDFGAKGLMYPSVKSAGAGMNLVIYPNEVDSGVIKFDRTLYGHFYQRDDSCCNEYTGMAISEDNENLIWKDAYHRLHKSIKEFYIGITNYNPIGTIPITDLGKPIDISDLSKA